MSVFLLGRISIQARNSGFRKHLLQDHFGLFCSFAQKVKMLAATTRTLLGNLLGIGAVMAEKEILGPMISQRNTAVLTLNVLPAASAEHRGRKSAPIQQNQNLFLAIQSILNGTAQVLR